MAVDLIYGDALLVSTNWTNASNAVGSDDSTTASATVVGSPLSLSLADLPGTADLTATSITYGARYAAQRGTSGRNQSALIELLDGSNNVLFSFNTGTVNTATLANFTATQSVSYTRAQVAALRVRVTPQEGTGMDGTKTHWVAWVRAEVTYTLFAELDQAAWRWRDDDGSESAASWLAAIDTPHEFNLSSGNAQARLRFLVSEVGGAPVTGESPQLQTGFLGGEPDDWTQQTSGFGESYVGSIAYGNGVWVAVGNSGKLATATDPTGTWTQQTSSFGTSAINGIAYGNGVWVAVGNDGKLATATDPTGTWTQQTSNFDITGINGIAYGNGVWVAVGNSGKLATATDPTGTWTQRTSSFDTTSILIVVYANSVWIAAGLSGKLATATDPTGTWTQQTSSFGTSAIRGVSYGNLAWVAVGAGGKLATATDPTGTWTQQTSSFGTSIINAIAYGSTTWAAVGVDGKLATATDPTGTWTQQTSSFGTSEIRAIAYLDKLWTAGGGNFLSDTGKIATGTRITWSNITTTSSPVKAFDSTHLTNGGNTTQQLGAGTFISSNAGISEDGSAGPTNFAGSDEAEYEFTVEFIADDLDEGAELKFRVI